MDSLTTNPKGFDGDTIVSHKSAMEHLPKAKSIWSSVVNDNLVHIQNYREEFIFILNHHTQSTEDGVQDIATCLEIEGSK